MSPTDNELHQLLLSLDRNTTPEHRLHVVDQLVLYWLGPCPPEEQYSDAELAEFEAPNPLKRLFSVLGRRRWPDNTMVNLPKDLGYADDSHITVATENQDVWEIRTDAAGDDPRVYTNMRDESTFELLPESLSELLIQLLLFGFVSTAPVCLHAWELPSTQLNPLVNLFQPLPLPPFQAPIYPWVYLAKPGVFAVVHRGTKYPNEAIVGAKSEDKLALLQTAPTIDWERW